MTHTRKKKFEYGRVGNGQFYWRLKAGNGEIIAQGEGYVGEPDCLHVFSLLCSVNSESTNVVRKRRLVSKQRPRKATSITSSL